MFFVLRFEIILVPAKRPRISGAVGVAVTPLDLNKQTPLVLPSILSTFHIFRDKPLMRATYISLM